MPSDHLDTNIAVLVFTVVVESNSTSNAQDDLHQNTHVDTKSPAHQTKPHPTEHTPDQIARKSGSLERNNGHRTLVKHRNERKRSIKSYAFGIFQPNLHI